MAATVTLKKRKKILDGFINIADVKIGTYAAGGVLISPNQLGLSVIDFILPSTSGGYAFEFNHTTGKLKAFAPGTSQAKHTHTFTGTDLKVTPTTLAAEPTTKLLQNDTGVLKSTDITAINLGKPAGAISESAAAATPPAAEVADGESIKDVVVRLIAIGY